MDRKRFVSFRNDLGQLKDRIANQNREQVEGIFSKLAGAYPELCMDEDSMPDLVVKSVLCMDEDSMPDLVVKSVRKDRVVQESIDTIRKQLIDSINKERFKDYTEYVLVMDNEETCLDSLRKLDDAINDSRKRIVYFSCLQGQVLKRLREITGKKMSALLKMTSYSQSYAYFLINLHELADKYNDIMYSTLPIRFFKSKLKTIATICDSLQ